MSHQLFSLLLLTCMVFYSGQAFADGAPEGRPSKTGTKLAPEEIAKYQYCGYDSECVVVQNGCCDCANGGEDVAINQRHLKTFKERFDCLETMCTLRAAVPPCGSGTVSCVGGKCRYYPRASMQ